jgi:hypothetical protein
MVIMLSEDREKAGRKKKRSGKDRFSYLGHFYLDADSSGRRVPKLRIFLGQKPFSVSPSTIPTIPPLCIQLSRRIH